MVNASQNVHFLDSDEKLWLSPHLPISPRINTVLNIRIAVLHTSAPIFIEYLTTQMCHAISEPFSHQLDHTQSPVSSGRPLPRFLVLLLHLSQDFLTTLFLARVA